MASMLPFRFWLFPLVFKMSEPNDMWPSAQVLIQSGRAVSPPIARQEPSQAVWGSWGLVPEDCQVVLPDVSQQDLSSPLQGLENLLQAPTPAVAFPEHRVHLQGLEQHVL